MSDGHVEHGELREGDLVAYMEGAASLATARHIAGCADCQAELAGLRAAERLLSVALARADCPAPERLLQRAAGLLAPGEAAAVDAHLDGCADCRDELAELAGVPAAPAPRPAPAPAGPGLIEQLARAGRRVIQAILAPAPAPALALRGDGPRSIAYRAGGYQLLLSIGPAPGGRAQIEGQLISDRGETAGTARLLDAGAERQSAAVDDLGFFALDEVPPGEYALLLDLGDEQILVDTISAP